jgi:hypothetical protein
MLAARDDELIAPPQLFAVEHLVGTPAHHQRKAMAPCRHVGLFMGKRTLEKNWPEIARWIGLSNAALKRSDLVESRSRLSPRRAPTSRCGDVNRTSNLNRIASPAAPAAVASAKLERAKRQPERSTRPQA